MSKLPNSGLDRARQGKPRWRHVICDPLERDAVSAELRIMAERSVEHDFADRRESGLVVLREGGAPRREACPVPTTFLPVPAVRAGESRWPSTALLADMLDVFADNTLMLVHGALNDLLSDLVDQLRTNGVPYALVTHGCYARAGHGRETAPAGEAARLEAARFVEVSHDSEVALLRRIAPLSRVRFAGRDEDARPLNLPTNRNCAGRGLFASSHPHMREGEGRP